MKPMKSGELNTALYDGRRGKEYADHEFAIMVKTTPVHRE